MLDFDGTLSEIVARPEVARPVDGAREVLGELAVAFRVVAVITGRRSEEVAALLDVPGVRFFGLYGIQDAAPELLGSVAPLVEVAVASVPDAWVENKGVSIAVHYRQARDPAAARAALVVGLQPLATENGLELVEGKMVFELVPRDRPMKGGTIERLVGELNLEAVLFAGDDVADLDAFSALGRLAGRGVLTLRVAVRGSESPPALVQAADVVVEGPAGLIRLLRQLV